MILPQLTIHTRNFGPPSYLLISECFSSWREIPSCEARRFFCQRQKETAKVASDITADITVE